MFSANTIFPECSSVGPRDWGREDVLVLSHGKFTMKRLFLRKGSQGGLQYHRLKDEAGILITGRLLIKFDLGDGVLQERILTEGEFFHFPPGFIHQERAIENCIIIEVSTPHFNDRVRCEAQYNLPTNGGLPTTTHDDIQFL